LAPAGRRDRSQRLRETWNVARAVEARNDYGD
jgi:hypothetical protein